MKNLLLLFVTLMFSIVAFSQVGGRALSREEQLNEKYCSGLFSTPNGTYFDLEHDEETASAIS